jgi:ATP-dependent Lhr-like helicase
MLASPLVAKQFRMNVGTIVELPMLKVRLRRGAVLGEVEEYFVQGLVPGDTFVFAGRLLRFEGMRSWRRSAAPATGGEPKVPAYGGGRLPLSPSSPMRVRGMLQDPALAPQAAGRGARVAAHPGWRSMLPPADGLLVEPSRAGGKQFLVAYCFEGRNAHQTLGMLLTGAWSAWACGRWASSRPTMCSRSGGLRPASPSTLDELFDEDMLGDDLEAWMDESSMLKRSSATSR